MILVGLVLVQFGSRWVGSRFGFGFGFGSGWRQPLPKARQRRVEHTSARLYMRSTHDQSSAESR